MRATDSRSYIAGGKIKRLTNFDHREYESLQKMGINLNRHVVDKMFHGHLGMMEMQAMAMDAVQPTVTTASIPTPVQFLQNWLPGLVDVITAKRKADDILGINTTGYWEDEQVVQGVLERTGSTQVYGDYTNVPLSSWNINYNYRTVVRFEEGMKVGRLESARASRARIDDSGAKREAAAVSLEIVRNTVAFLGFNGGANNTYGFLNDPNLLPYTTVATNAAGTSTLWANKTYLEITNDLRVAVATLRSQSQDTVDPKEMELTLVIATDVVDFLTTVSQFGNSVQEWLDESYKNVRVVSAPQLNDANGGANVFYLFADRIEDSSTDGGQTFIQMVPARFQVLGVEQQSKAYVEDFSNATAGTMVKRPFACTRWSGI